VFARITLAAVAVTALALTVIGTSDALAGKGGGGGPLDTTISMDSQTQMAVSASSVPMVFGDAVFTVTRSYPYDKDTIWVTNQCWDDAGNMVVDRDTAVMWGTSTSLIGVTNPMPTDGVTCTAYVTLRPWQDRVLGDSIMNYLVGQ